MRPKYIFGAVIAICILMGTVLPHLAASAPRAEAAAVVKYSPTPASAPNITPIQPGVPTLAPFNVAAAQTNPTPQPTVQAKHNARSAKENVPSPVDPAGQSGADAAIPATAGPQDLAAFISSVIDGQANNLAGVYVSGQFSLPVVQQPAGEVNFVSSDEQAVTEYSRSDAYGVVGLLAHNTLPAGGDFYKLKPGQEVLLIYGDGRQARYHVQRVEFFQALSPTDPYSDFVDLNQPGGNIVLNEDLFQRIYTTTGQLIFQTCLAANGDPSWGRMFVIATPG